MAEYTPCKRPDPTAREAIGNVMREIRGIRKRKSVSKDMRREIFEECENDAHALFIPSVHRR